MSELLRRFKDKEIYKIDDRILKEEVCKLMLKN